ncbi:hypothetical protein MYX76_04450 [Desulfobacterota bacterium AH_259_B03_O07]|nr:hypothetical protein [Desulfobacterota bacterium AH_259_B03_O07]
MKIRRNSFRRELPSEDTILARCISIIDLGMQKKPQFKNKIQHDIAISFELDEKMSNGLPFVQTRFYSLSLGDKAHLRRDIESWLGRKLTGEELDKDGFEMKSLLLQWAMVSIVHVESGGETYSNIVGITRPDKQTRARLESHKELPVNETIFFDLENSDDQVFELIPEWLQKKIEAREIEEDNEAEEYNEEEQAEQEAEQQSIFRDGEEELPVGEAIRKMKELNE